MTTKSKPSPASVDKIVPAEKVLMQFPCMESKGNIASYNPLNRSMFFYLHKAGTISPYFPKKRGKIF